MRTNGKRLGRKNVPHPFSFGDLKSVLCIGAHADDIEIGCGGTILRLQEDFPNLTIHWQVLSGGDATLPHGLDRRQEAFDAAERFVSSGQRGQLEVHAFRDAHFPTQYAELKACLGKLAQELEPCLVLTHQINDMHQDHRAVAEIALQAFRNQPVIGFEIPKYDGDLGRPNLYVDLPAAVHDRKLDLLMTSFPSQQEKHWFSRDTFAGLMRIRGVESNSASGQAEAFYASKLTV